jgi:transposase
MPKQYHVTLTEEQRQRLLAQIGAGRDAARALAHARILLKADQGLSDTAIAAAVEVSRPTVERVRKQFVQEGLEATLTRRPPDRVYQRKLDGTQEARLVALACGEPPAGQARWSLRLLADRLVDLEVVDQVSYQTVRRVLKKTRSSPGSSASG